MGVDHNVSRILSEADQAEIQAYAASEFHRQAELMRSGQRVYFWMRLVSHVLVTLVPIVILVLLLTPLGDDFGVRSGWFALPADAEAGATVQAEQIKSSLRDMLTVIVPLFLGVAIWLVTVVAERRLKEYDGTLERFRDASLKSFQDFKKEVLDEGKSLKGEISDQIGSIRKEYDGTLERFRDSSLKSFQGFKKELLDEGKSLKGEISVQIGSIKSEVSGLDDKVFNRVMETVAVKAKEQIDMHASKIKIDFDHSSSAVMRDVSSIYNEIDGKFGFLLNTKTVIEGVGALSSVSQVYAAVMKFFREKNVGGVVAFVSLALDEFEKGRNNPRMQRISGDLNDWFNLSAVLGQRDLEALALRVCLAGLEQQGGVAMPADMGQWPANLRPNYDLLAHAIKYASEINAPELPGLLELSGYNSDTGDAPVDWTWRSYVFVMDGLDCSGRAAQAIDLGRLCMSRHPKDPELQKVVTKTATLLWVTGQRDEAVSLVKDWLSANPTAPAAQVVTKLVDWCLGVSPAQDIVAWVDRGIRDLAEEQPSSSLGNLLYARALARDWLAHDTLSQGKGDEAVENARRALGDYEQAVEAGINDSLVAAVGNRRLLLNGILTQLGQKPPQAKATSGSDQETASQHASALLRLLLEEDCDDKTFARAQMIFNKISESARPAVLAKYQELADHADAPDELRHSLQWFLACLEKASSASSSGEKDSEN